MELKIIAIGIDSWAPITSGDIILEAFIDKYKNKFTPTPMDNEKANKGKIYFLFGNVILQKGIKLINTIPILNEPNKIGGKELFKASLEIGNALPNKIVISNNRSRCLFCI